MTAWSPGGGGGGECRPGVQYFYKPGQFVREMVLVRITCFTTLDPILRRFKAQTIF